SLSFVPPIYGADITDSITDSDSPQYINYVNKDQNESYAGVTTPYLYMGSWKTTFSWHVEDMDLYAINYLHFGMPKTWYCVPPKHGHLLEKACRSLFPSVANWCSNFMRHKTSVNIKLRIKIILLMDLCMAALATESWNSSRDSVAKTTIVELFRSSTNKLHFVSLQLVICLIVEL
ncbi:Uncharacterized protein FKW44_019013, partial [Caligus rogercresseyi]